MPSSFVARIRENETIMREHKNLYGKGITPSYNAEKDVVQISFENYSREDTETWLREHEFKEFSLIEGEELKDVSRTYGYTFANIGGKFERLPDGGLRVKGVKLLAAGTWTDSAQKTPCEYSPETLNQYAGNWHDNAIWSRHFGGTPRNITEKVGLVENPRFESDAVVGDLYYHGLTQQSRDTIAMVENGLANYVSVETTGKERWNVGKKVNQAYEIGFTGLATVNQGACRVCKIRDNELGKELESSVPGNPSGYGIGSDSSSCKLSLSDFTDKTWDELSSTDKSKIASHFAFNDGTDTFGALKLPHHDPGTGDVRPNCVRAALQAIGGARSGNEMDLGGKEESVKSHLNSHMEEINKNEKKEMSRENEIVSDKDSLEKLRDKIREALQVKFHVNQDSGYGPYILTTLPDQVIYEISESGIADKKYRIPYQIDESGTVMFGEPIEVTIAYQDTNEQKHGAFEQVTEMEEKELEAKFEAIKKEMSESSGKKIAELEAINKELSARLEKIESAPVPKTYGSADESREMEAPVMVSIKNGTISRRV